MTKTKIPSARGRLDGLDIARYIAFVGMVIVNFKIAMGADSDGSFLSNFTSALEGRAAATFVVLAGIGLGLSNLKNARQTVIVTFKRALFLLVLGLLNMLIFDADILHYYAFYFFLGALLLPLENRVMISVILGLNLAFVAMILTLNYDLGWNWEDYTYSDFWTLAGFIRNLFFNGWHPVIPWLGFLLFGIVLSRTALAERFTQVVLILGGVFAFAAAEGLGFFLTAYLTSIDPELATLATTEPVPPMPLYTLAGLGAASIVVGLCLMLSKQFKSWGVLRVIVPAGRQTLTLYVGHILVGMGTLEAMGMLGGQTITQAVLASLLFCLGATVYALLWSKWFKRGPVEALMRALAG